MSTFLNQSGINALDPFLLQERNILEGLEIVAVGPFSIPENHRRSIANMPMTKAKCIGSYNWLEADQSTPTIIVPGSPPQWRPRPLPHSIPFPDQGMHIIDQGGYRMSNTRTSTLLPLICAVNKCAELNNENFDWSSIDIVTDRSALRKLLRWANGKALPTRMSRQSDGNFRIDLEMAGEGTLLMSRVPLCLADRFDGRGYRRGFEKAFTLEPEVGREALDHYRVVTYNLAGIKMVVRFEVDAFMPEAQHDSQVSSQEVDSYSIDQLSNALASATITTRRTAEPTRYHGVTVMVGGQQVPQSSIVEFKTQSHRNRRPIDWAEVYSQIFLSQTDSLIWAQHDRGQFGSVQRIQLTSSQLEAVKEEAQLHIGQLVDVLLAARELFRRHGGQAKLSLVCIKGTLNVHQRNGPDSFLSNEVRDLFNGSTRDEEDEGDN
ncbi:hypothetical protein CPB83DRAFT_911260 [Crepidotus variabilis]|uniref:Geranylgeranyl pyrophosphate synthetase n=1 Tax=Crepidotus variabilis TaxID=179855 RepID=A0A9P6E4U9_9AGAR|nr:hypothetical protein CPB83DRAFT_911260 [Crepidotus variabilis]